MINVTDAYCGAVKSDPAGYQLRFSSILTGYFGERVLPGRPVYAATCGVLLLAT
jgi:hypothetical protein